MALESEVGMVFMSVFPGNLQHHYIFVTRSRYSLNIYENEWENIWMKVIAVAERQQWMVEWSEILIPRPGTEPGYPGWKPES